MKVLILSCHTGEGHNSAAAAVEQMLLSRGIGCERDDALRFLSQGMSRAICHAHVGLYVHAPKLFTFAYRTTERHRGVFSPGTPLYRLLTRGSERLYDHLIRGGYDTVVCTHVFGALLVTDLREKHPDFAIKSAFVATDYTCTPSVEQCNVDIFFIPDATLTDEFVSTGIPAERIKASGLPLRAPFLTRRPRKEACLSCGLEQDKRHVLMMCGSMGCGPMEKLTRRLAEQMPADVVLTVICGTNQKLERRLSNRFADRQNVRVLGYADNVPALMDAADLYLTKPGGISISEAIAKQLPMVLVNIVAGCEQHNLRYCLERGMAKHADTPRAISALCVELLSDASALADMRGQMERYAQGNATQRIVAHLDSLDPSQTNEGNSL